MIGGAYVTYSEVTGVTPTEADIAVLLTPMNARAVLFLLARMNLHIRLARSSEKKTLEQAIGEAQSWLFSNFFNEDLFDQIRNHLQHAKTHERALFHPLQLLNVARLTVEVCRGKNDTEFITDDERFSIGRACLMMNDLLTTTQDNARLQHGGENLRMAELMTQLLPGFEVNNPGDLRGLLNRSIGAFNLLLSDKQTKQECIEKSGGYDLTYRFRELTGVELKHWIAILFSSIAYFNFYAGLDGAQQQIDFLTIVPSTFIGRSKIPEEQLRKVLDLVAQDPAQYAANFESSTVKTPVNVTPFMFRPLVRNGQGYNCADFGFLTGKLFSGAYWTMHDRESRAGRDQLASAWGILFERYVNWWVKGRTFPAPLVFHPFPKWQSKKKNKSGNREGDEVFDGMFLNGSRLMALEYKGGFLRLDAKFSMNVRTLLRDLHKKIAKACRQLTRSLDLLFGISSDHRLVDVPTEHITRVVPVIVVQDQALRSVGLDWWINRQFEREMRRVVLRPTVTVEPATLIHIEDFELMIDSAENPEFDLFAALQFRNTRDPKRTSVLNEYLHSCPGFGSRHSTRQLELEQEFERCIIQYAFDAADLTSTTVEANVAPVK